MTLQHVLEKKRSNKPTFTPERSILRQKTDIRIGKETRVRRGKDDEDILAALRGYRRGPLRISSRAVEDILTNRDMRRH